MQRDVVLILLFDAEGSFLLQHRDDDAPTYPGCWGFFGGGTKEGETPIAAARREAFEELRHTLAIVDPVLVVDYRDEKTGRFGRKFYFTEVCPAKEQLELHEGQDMGWFTLAEARSLRITEGNLQMIEEIIRRGSGPHG